MFSALSSSKTSCMNEESSHANDCNQRAGSSEGTIRTPQGVRSVTLYLGDCSNERDIMLLLHGHMSRVAKGKALADYPIVFTEEKGLDVFFKLRGDALNKYRESPWAEDVDIDDDEDLDVRASTYLLTHVSVSMAREFHFRDDLKVYVFGHGRAGVCDLIVDQKIFSMRDVVRKMADVNVPKGIKDVRLISCGSADAREVPDLSVANLQVYSEMYSADGRIYQAPAQALVDALSDEGFDNVVVTGYHGDGLVYKGQYFPESALRGASIAPGLEVITRGSSEDSLNVSGGTSDDFSDEMSPDEVRRSSVAQKFSHIKDVR